MCNFEDESQASSDTNLSDWSYESSDERNEASSDEEEPLTI